VRAHIVPPYEAHHSLINAWPAASAGCALPARMSWTGCCGWSAGAPSAPGHAAGGWALVGREPACRASVSTSALNKCLRPPLPGPPDAVSCRTSARAHSDQSGASVDRSSNAASQCCDARATDSRIRATILAQAPVHSSSRPRNPARYVYAIVTWPTGTSSTASGNSGRNMPG